ncbi:hypothetical protein P389DRAFT_82455 [Cystobasidium minutum MCA 4210]|uniref:uncharacterized protein n=1 Tax=Cystobasidium minutum MCA 4210 TaxID=1397322 RepID=UPI0034CD2B6A|eukprot:jgi/Rhomi1/82455/CE82454_552
MATASTSNTRIPIKLSPHVFASKQEQDGIPAYHALVHDHTAEIRGATVLSSSNSGNVNNGGTTTTLTLNDADGATKLDGRMNPATLHDYVLLYDEASRSYVLHKLSSITRLQASSSGFAGTKPITPNPRNTAAAGTGNTYSPGIARTPQSTNSPSISASSSKFGNTARARQTSSYLSPSAGSAASGTAKKLTSNQKKHSNGYDSSPTPSTVGKSGPAAYGLGISSGAASGRSPSVKNATPSSYTAKGKAPIHDVEEFDMGTSDEDLVSSKLQLPPSQGSLPTSTSSRPTAHNPRPPAAAPASTSLSMFANSDVVMSESSSDEDEGDFADLANDLESSLVGQGPFARLGAGAAAGNSHALISSDDDEDDDSDFVNAFAEQQAPVAQRQPNTQPPPPQQQQLPHQQRSQATAPSQPAQRQQPPPPVSRPLPQASRPTQAGKKLPTTRKYDSDIASSSESDDDSD